MKEMLQALPSLVDINVPDSKHFTVCGDVHGQVDMCFWLERCLLFEILLVFLFILLKKYFGLC